MYDMKTSNFVRNCHRKSFSPDEQDEASSGQTMTALLAAAWLIHSFLGRDPVAEFLVEVFWSRSEGGSKFRGQLFVHVVRFYLYFPFV